MASPLSCCGVMVCSNRPLIIPDRPYCLFTDDPPASSLRTSLARQTATINDTRELRTSSSTPCEWPEKRQRHQPASSSRSLDPYYCLIHLTFVYRFWFSVFRPLILMHMKKKTQLQLTVRSRVLIEFYLYAMQAASDTSIARTTGVQGTEI